MARNPSSLCLVLLLLACPGALAAQETKWACTERGEHQRGSRVVHVELTQPDILPSLGEVHIKMPNLRRIAMTRAEGWTFVGTGTTPTTPTTPTTDTAMRSSSTHLAAVTITISGMARRTRMVAEPHRQERSSPVVERLPRRSLTDALPQRTTRSPQPD